MFGLQNHREEPPNTSPTLLKLLSVSVFRRTHQCVDPAQRRFQVIIARIGFKT
jgi:hypothetical protein